MAQWPAFTPTRFPEIGLTQCAPDLWRWVDTETAAIVGPQYRTKAEALADLERYAFENWGLGTRTAPDPVRDAAPELLAEARATAVFLDRLAEHLEFNGMPGQAGNCAIRAQAVRAAIAKAEGR